MSHPTILYDLLCQNYSLQLLHQTVRSDPPYPTKLTTLQHDQSSTDSQVQAVMEHEGNDRIDFDILKHNRFFVS